MRQIRQDSWVRQWSTTIVITMGVALVAVLGGSSLAHAQSFRSGNNVTLGSSQSVDSTMFAAGRSLDIAGTVNGDVICAGNNITISGTVNGDVICAGQNVRIDGTVTGDVRLAGQTVSIDGKVDGNASIAAQNTTLASKSNIGQDVAILTQDATLNGSVGRDVAASAGSIDLNGGVGRDVQAQVEDLHLGADAKVDGRVHYTGSKEATQDRGAQVAGGLQRTAMERPQHHGPSIAGFGITAAIFLLIALLVTPLILVLIMPNVFHAATNRAMRGAGGLGRTFLIGVIASLLVPIVITTLFATIIGIPLALLLLLLWWVAALLSGPMAAYLLGRLVARRQTNAILIMLIGSVILLVLYLIPFVNLVALLLAYWFGLGTLLRHGRQLSWPQYEMAVAEDPNLRDKAIVQGIEKTAHRQARAKHSKDRRGESDDE